MACIVGANDRVFCNKAFPGNSEQAEAWALAADSRKDRPFMSAVVSGAKLAIRGTGDMIVGLFTGTTEVAIAKSALLYQLRHHSGKMFRPEEFVGAIPASMASGMIEGGKRYLQAILDGNTDKVCEGLGYAGMMGFLAWATSGVASTLESTTAILPNFGARSFVLAGANGGTFNAGAAQLELAAATPSVASPAIGSVSAMTVTFDTKMRGTAGKKAPLTFDGTIWEIESNVENVLGMRRTRIISDDSAFVRLLEAKNSLKDLFLSKRKYDLTPPAKALLTKIDENVAAILKRRPDLKKFLSDRPIPSGGTVNGFRGADDLANGLTFKAGSGSSVLNPIGR